MTLGDRSIVDEAKQLVQGLSANTDGQRILGTSSQKQKALRDFLVSGELEALERLPKALRDALARGEELALDAIDDGSEDAEPESETPVLRHHAANHSKLKLMNRLAAQVTTCRTSMRGSYAASRDPDAAHLAGRPRLYAADPWRSGQGFRALGVRRLSTGCS